MNKSKRFFLIYLFMCFIPSLFAYSNKDKVLEYLDNGINNYYNGNYETAISDLLKAENEIYTNYTKSISEEVGSFIINDTVKAYPGEVYEDIYINIFKSLCYYNLGQLNDAIVEVNRFTNKIKKINTNNQVELEKIRQALKDDSLAVNDLSFHNSALGEYLLMIYYNAVGDTSTRNTAKKRIDEAFEIERDLYNFPKPSTISKDSVRGKKDTRLNVIAFSGVAPKKIEEKKAFSDQFMLSVPALERQETFVNFIKVKATNTDTGKTYNFSLEKIEELSNIAFETFINKSKISYYKALARAIAKNSTTIGTKIAGDILSDSDNLIASLAGNILSSTSIMNENYTDMTEKADLRYCKYLPSSTYVGGVNLDSGTYDIIISYYDDLSSSPLYTQTVYNKQVNTGKLNLVDSSSVKKELSLIEEKERKSTKYSMDKYSADDGIASRLKFDLGVEPALDGSRVFGMIGYNWTDAISSTLNLSYSSSSEQYETLEGFDNVLGIKKERGFEGTLSPLDYNYGLFDNLMIGANVGLSYQYLFNKDNAGMFSMLINPDDTTTETYMNVNIAQSGHIIAPSLGAYAQYSLDYMSFKYNILINPVYHLAMKSDMEYKYQVDPSLNMKGNFDITRWSSPFIEQKLTIDILTFIRLMVNFKYQHLNLQQLDYNPEIDNLSGFDDKQDIFTFRTGIELLGGKKNNAKIKGGFYYEYEWGTSSYNKEMGYEDTFKNSKWGFTIGTGN